MLKAVQIILHPRAHFMHLFSIRQRKQNQRKMAIVTKLYSSYIICCQNRYILNVNKVIINEVVKTKLF